MYLPLTLERRQQAKARLSARQRLATDLLLAWEEGLGALRLGKQYFAVKPGDLIWLPAGTLFALGASDASAFSVLWLSKRLALALPGQVGLLADPWFAATLARATAAQGEHRQGLLKVLAGELATAKPQALGQVLPWPAPGALAPLALIEAGRQGQHQQGLDIDPRPLALTPA
ncbi:AraC family ligand binding domain-containing protein [Gallaecimonas xiamenensis]|uniref:AraC-type arabinose-binding/dimerisation domain-containing protein n=1 Tax=Gallaecimonas xiamenensis 3-C-1 TaxID=745411 RepID=K2JN93_9GAMM|nr:AraC family ligand binding domain-containing protein [Gallaecimonas xiamenensis]EKE76723.1 hypothetical protein B3C1_03980 [Gallaecimonas xiamenensis 3-C-1]